MEPAIDGATFFAETQTEREFTDAVKAYAKARGWLVYHTYDSRRSDPGFPDLVLVRGTRIIFAELKREKGGRVSSEQRAWLDAINGVAARVAAVLHDGTSYVTPGVDHDGLMCPEALEIIGAFIWKPSSWPQIEEVLS